MQFIKLLMFLPFLFSQCASTNPDKAHLVYVGDPMCSWCYGFSPELNKALKSLEKEVDVEIVMGGLRPYNTQTMQELEGFLQHHWEDVHKASGQEFSYGILKDHSFVYDTEPACRAVVVMRKLNPAKELDFFKDIQRAFYYDNQNTHDVQTYIALAKKYGVKAEDFKQEFESEAMKKAVRDDFNRANEMGVRGFPTVLLKQGEEYVMISNGYTKAEEVVQKIQALLSAKKE